MRRRGIFPCKPGGPNDYVYLLTSRANPEHWPRLLKLIGREELIGDPRYDTASARVEHEAEVNEIIAQWTRRHTKEEAMALISGAGVPAGAVFNSMELTNEPSFYERGILQTMQHGDWKMTMTTWPVRFDGAPAPIKPAPLLGEHTTEVLGEWLGLSGEDVAGLRQKGSSDPRARRIPPSQPGEGGQLSRDCRGGSSAPVSPDRRSASGPAAKLLGECLGVRRRLEKETNLHPVIIVGAGEA